MYLATEDQTLPEVEPSPDTYIGFHEILIRIYNEDYYRENAAHISHSDYSGEISEDRTVSKM